MTNDFETFWEKTVRERCLEYGDELFHTEGEYREAQRQYSAALHQAFPRQSELSDCMEDAMMGYLITSDNAMYQLGLRDGIGLLKAMGVLD